ncbi:1443_t:CDS:2 [Paraglomus occultum]|uniref:1443_t:CDS:1 n=1 Tax=Paraglomus occultum TaxID=144539 RepID=A0A9N8VNE4_9GLOM|nr:1443_t:CDS:2 [Paraglomus occultum]
MKSDPRSVKRLQKKKDILESKIAERIKRRKEKLNSLLKRKQRKGPHRQDSLPIFGQSNTQFLPSEVSENSEREKINKMQEKIRDLEQQLNAEQQEIERLNEENRLIKEIVEIKEIEELKIKDLNMQKSQLLRNIDDIKKEVGKSLENMVDLFLKSQEIISREKRENDQFAKEHLEILKNYLLQKLTPEQVKELTRLQNQITKLEKQLTNFQKQRAKFEEQIEVPLSRK